VPTGDYTDDVARVMFGDPFGNRGDYSKGFFYGGRRRYLHKDRSINIMQPPDDFMTHTQRRHNLKIQNEGIHLVQKLEFNRKPQENEESLLTKALEKSKKDVMKNKGIVVIKKVPTFPSDWEEKHEAGCTFWVHKSTGVSVAECPQPELYESRSRAQSTDNTNSLFLTNGAIEHTGTGSIVYESSEYENFIDTLDSMMKSSTKTNK
jgi:hypothetical protein